MARKPRNTLHNMIMREAALCSRMKPRKMEKPMTDQKIEEIRARWIDGYKSQSIDRSEYGKSMAVMIDVDYLLTELDRLKAELDDKDRDFRSMRGERDQVIGHLRRLRDQLPKCEACGGHGEEGPTQQDPLGSGAPCPECNGTGCDTLKASGTFSDGVEAAAKLAVDDGGYELAARIRDLKPAAPQPRPDAQGQRERELALVKSACDYVIRFYTAKDWSGPFLGYSDILEAFDMRHHD